MHTDPKSGGARVPRGVYFFLFTLSGFAGLIYESIWSHYLKLFLGHAAYAQSLVLAIFMGGMAVGAWICTLRAWQTKNLLLGYAVAEVVIGLFALCFHWVFVATTGFAYDSMFPFVESPLLVGAVKWALAGVLILPQSVLLGMTFPLMSAGIMRAYPSTPGSSLAMLYFTNSLGAAIGVLASGFFLIALVGMPGTLLTAGLVNIVLAIAVWLAVRIEAPRQLHSVPPQESKPTLGGPSLQAPYLRVLLGVSLLSGAASFAYEIGWIRMLSLVLGSSSHAFELMLSAFILGIAFGGLWIKRRIDAFRDVLGVVSLVLIAKGIMALATLPVYGKTFELMQATISSLAKTEFSYGLFNFGSHLISLSVMFPAAFCAGMSLPLITFSLLKTGCGESSIGKVYAWNTLGAIIGVLFAVHIGMPMLGLKNLIVVAACIDIAAALAVLYLLPAGRSSWLPIAACAGVVAVITSAWAVEFDSLKMASGVYRHGRLKSIPDAEVIFHKDGKTASVDVVRTGNFASILTNGKSDAALAIAGTRTSADESTMVLIGAVPLAHKPHATKVANIGFGSGLTTHTVLSSPRVEVVDTVEIEPAMVEGARHFGKVVERAFSDPRSRIHFDDAKSFFSGRNEKYDLILSEPSNPWVSGVSGLFSLEFYARVKNYLKEDGFLVQWIQMYEIDSKLVASIMTAIGQSFSDYVVYEIGMSDMLVIAIPNGSIPPLTDSIFRMPNMVEQINRLGIRDVNSLHLLRTGGKRHLAHAFGTFGAPANSDYFPYVDLNAARLRFLGREALEIGRLAATPVPSIEMLERRDFPIADSATADGAYHAYRQKVSAMARSFAQLFLTGQSAGVRGAMEHDQDLLIATMRNGLLNCVETQTRPSLVNLMFDVVSELGAQMSVAQAEKLWQAVEDAKCYRELPVLERDWIRVYKAVGLRDAKAMVDAVDNLLRNHHTPARAQLEYLLAALMTGHIALDNPKAAKAAWDRYGNQVVTGEKLSAQMRMLVGLATAGASLGQNR